MTEEAWTIKRRCSADTAQHSAHIAQRYIKSYEYIHRQRMLQKVVKIYQVIITDMNRHDDLIANDPLYMTALHVRCSALHQRYIFQYSFVMPSPSLSIITLPRPQNPNFTSFPHPGSTHRKILWVLNIDLQKTVYIYQVVGDFTQG